MSRSLPGPFVKGKGRDFFGGRHILVEEKKPCSAEIRDYFKRFSHGTFQGYRLR